MKPVLIFLYFLCFYPFGSYAGISGQESQRCYTTVNTIKKVQQFNVPSARQNYLKPASPFLGGLEDELIVFEDEEDLHRKQTVLARHFSSAFQFVLNYYYYYCLSNTHFVSTPSSQVSSCSKYILQGALRI